MGRIIIIRHGNRLDFIDPLWANSGDQTLLTCNTTNSPLSVCGFKQSEEVAAYISEKYHVKYIYSSPYLRALQTAHPICTALNIPIFVENSVAEGGTEVSANVPSRDTEKYFEKFSIDYTYKSVGIPFEDESYLDVHIRVLPFVAVLEEKSREGDVLIFTHAITKVALVRGLMRDPTLNVRVSTCSITEIEFPSIEAKPILHQLCSVEHLKNKGEHTWGIWPNSKEQQDIALKMPKIYEEAFSKIKAHNPSDYVDCDGDLCEMAPKDNLVVHSPITLKTKI